MKKLISIILTAIIICGGMSFSVVAEEISNSTNSFIESAAEIISENSNDLSEEQGTNRIVVSSKEELDVNDAESYTVSENGLYIIQYSNEKEAEEACEKFTEENNVEYACEDIVFSICETKTDSDYISYEFGTDYIDMNNYSTWLKNNTENLPEVIVAVIDTGVDYTHPLVKNRILTDIDYDFVNNDNDAKDDHYHGTHVSGIITDGTGDNVKILPLKCLNQTGNGSMSSVIIAIDYAVEHGADVINMSLGAFTGGDINPAMEAAINRAINAGVIICVAAGNCASDASDFSPANVASAITVASCDKSNALSSFSNYGDSVDIVAYGENIKSSVPYFKNASGYLSCSGTSMATPCVSAAAAMLKSYNKSINSWQAEKIISTNAIQYNYKNVNAGILSMHDIFNNTECNLLTTESMLMFPGQTTNIPYFQINGISPIIESDSPDIVSVENDVLIAHNPGKAKISLSASGNSVNFYAEVVSLEANASKSLIDVYVNSEDSLYINKNIDCSIEWQSLNENIATVNDGIVTGVSTGKCNIQAIVAKGTVSEQIITIPVNVRNIGMWYKNNVNDLYISTSRELYEAGVLTATKETTFYSQTIHLLNDIDLSEFDCWQPIGIEGNCFSGNFDGGNYTISNLIIDDPEAFGAGLFGHCFNAEIYNVRLKNARVNARSQSSCFAAQVFFCNINNCHVSGKLVGRFNEVGGLAGLIRGGTISNCSSDVSVWTEKDIRSSTQIALYPIAGFVKESTYNATIVNCINYGDCECGICYINSDTYISDLTFDNTIKETVNPSSEALIVNCVNVGHTNTNGIIIFNFGTVKNCYCLSKTSLCEPSNNDEGTIINYKEFNADYKFNNNLSLTKTMNSYVRTINANSNTMLLYWVVKSGKLVFTKNDPEASTHQCSINGHIKGETILSNIMEPTCEGNGFARETVYCSVCEKIISTGVITLNARGHNPASAVKENVSEATCTQSGFYSMVIRCQTCQKELNKTSYIIQKTGHKEGFPLQENYNEPSCAVEGGYDFVTRCVICDAELSRTHTIIKATGHKDNNGDGCCDICGISTNCNCLCHKTGFAAFVWKIILLFDKLGGNNQICICGAKHY